MIVNKVAPLFTQTFPPKTSLKLTKVDGMDRMGQKERNELKLTKWTKLDQN